MSNESIKDKRSNVLVQGSILAFASIVVRLIGLIYRIPLTRAIGDTAMGYYSYAYEIYNLALILSSYSIPLAVSKLVSARLIKLQYKNAHRVFVFSLIFSTCVGALMTFILAAGSGIYAELINCKNVVVPLRILAPTILVFSIMGVIRGYFQGHNNMLPTALSQIVEQIINAIVSIGAGVLMYNDLYDFLYSLPRDGYIPGGYDATSYGAGGGTLGTLSGAIAGLITLTIVYWIVRNNIKKRVEIDDTTDVESYAHIFKVLILTALPVIMSQCIYQVNATIDGVIYNKVASNQGVSEEMRTSLWGIYSNKYRLLTNVPVAVASALGTAVVPNLIAEYVMGHTDVVNKRIASVIKFNMIIAVPSAFAFITLASAILRLLFGDTNPVSADMLHIGGFCVVFYSLSTVTNGILQGINRMHLPLLHAAISLVIHFPLVLFFLNLPDVGVYGLVIGDMMLPFVICLLNMHSIRNLTGYDQELKTTFFIPMLSALLMGIAGSAFYNYAFPFIGLASAIIAIMICVPVYFFFLIRFGGLKKEELMEMPKGGALVKLLTKLRFLK